MTHSAALLDALTASGHKDPRPRPAFRIKKRPTGWTLWLIHADGQARRHGTFRTWRAALETAEWIDRRTAALQDGPTTPDAAVLAALNAETRRARTRIDAYTEDHITEMRAALTAALPYLTADAARAVVELTAERDAYREENTRLREVRARMEALADRLDAEAAAEFDGVSGTSVSLVKYETAKAIRAALEGETND